MNEENQNYLMGVMDIEDARTHLEKVMMEMNPNMTQGERRSYLQGVIDTLNDTGKIDSVTRTILYAQYGS